jgi:hypothetical protein
VANTGLFFLAVAVTILPAMLAMWWFLRRYEGYFEDARIFFSLAVGFFLGLFATAFEFLAFPFHTADFVDAMGWGTALFLFVAGYAFFETGAKVIALGLKKFRQRKDTPYYGAAMGLGFGAMAALLFVALNLNLSGFYETPYSARTFFVMVMVPVGGILAHGATGAIVGQGSAEGKLWKGWGYGALLQMPLLGTYWLFWPNIGDGTMAWSGVGEGLLLYIFPSVLALGYGLGLLLITQRRVLDPIVPADIRAQVARERRREARRKQRGEEEE